MILLSLRYECTKTCIMCLYRYKLLFGHFTSLKSIFHYYVEILINKLSMYFDFLPEASFLLLKLLFDIVNHDLFLSVLLVVNRHNSLSY
jgi:hypothetical protein